MRRVDAFRRHYRLQRFCLQRLTGRCQYRHQRQHRIGAEGKTTLNVLWWGSQTRHEMTTEMLEKFEELNPDIDVVMDYSDWDGYWTKLPAQVAGGQTPDVFQMDYAKLAEYVENGVTADLSSYIADGSLDMSNVEQNILDSGTVDAKSTRSLLVRMRLLCCIARTFWMSWA